MSKVREENADPAGTKKSTNALRLLPSFYYIPSYRVGSLVRSLINSCL